MVGRLPKMLFWGWMLLSSCLGVCALHLQSPTVKFTQQLPGSGDLGGRSLRKNNAVVLSADANTLFVTADDGSLHILDLQSTDGSGNTVFEPDPVIGAFTECQSGVALKENGAGGVVFAVYSVIDTPISAQVTYDGNSLAPDVASVIAPTSRVIAVNPDGTLRWSYELEGSAVGTPLLGADGDKVYMAHNFFHNQTAMTTLRGKVTVLSDNQGLITLAAEKFEPTRAGPYAPPAIQKAILGNQERDVVVWGESWGDGYVQDGQLYVLTPSNSFDTNGGIGDSSYDLNTFSQWNEPIVSRVAFSDDLSSLFVGARASQLAGWAGLTANGFVNGIANPTWSKSIQGTERNMSQPILNAPTISKDGALIYLPGSSYDLFCFDAQTGGLVWSDAAGRSIYLAEAKLSEPEGLPSVVYAIEALTGRVRQHDALSGQRTWEFDCSDLSGIASCQDSVEAEFSVSTDGNLLVYGDIFGTIVGLEVATFTSPPSTYPSRTPSEAASTAPSAVPSPIPSQTPSGAFAPSSTPTAPSQSPLEAASQFPTTTPTRAPTATLIRAPTTFPIQSPTTVPTGVPTTGLIGAPTTGLIGTPTIVPMLVSLPPTGEPSLVPPLRTPPQSGTPTSNLTRQPVSTSGSADEPNNESRGGGKNANTVLALVLALVSALIALAAAFFILFMLRRRSQNNRSDGKEEKDAALVWQQREMDYMEACRRDEAEFLAEVGSAQPAKPGRGRKKRKQTCPKPIMLESIEESLDEDASLATRRSQASPPLQEEGNDPGYLPVSLLVSHQEERVPRLYSGVKHMKPRGPVAPILEESKSESEEPPELESDFTSLLGPTSPVHANPSKPNSLGPDASDSGISNPDALETDAPKSEPPTPGAPKPEAPKADVLEPDVSKPDIPKPDPDPSYQQKSPATSQKGTLSPISPADSTRSRMILGEDGISVCSSLYIEDTFSIGSGSLYIEEDSVRGPADEKSVTSNPPSLSGPSITYRPFTPEPGPIRSRMPIVSPEPIAPLSVQKRPEPGPIRQTRSASPEPFDCRPTTPTSPAAPEPDYIRPRSPWNRMFNAIHRPYSPPPPPPPPERTSPVSAHKSQSPASTFSDSMPASPSSSATLSPPRLSPSDGLQQQVHRRVRPLSQAPVRPAQQGPVTEQNVWNTFLATLSKAENDFFNPAAPSHIRRMGDSDDGYSLAANASDRTGGS